MKTGLVIFELLVGLTSGIAALALLGSMATLSTATSTLQLVLYWVGLFLGPILLIVGAALILLGRTQRTAAMLMIVGSLVLTGWTIYLLSGVPAERARGALTLSLTFIVVAIVLFVFISDFAAYWIYKSTKY